MIGQPQAAQEMARPAGPRRAGVIGALRGLVLPVAVLVAFAGITGCIDLGLMTEMLVYLSLAQLWNLLAGYAGLVSVGQQAFIGIGGYALYSLTVLAGLPTLAALLLTGVAGLVLSAIGSVFIFRLTGAHFTIGTWVMAEICRLSVAVTPALGGGSGVSLPVAAVKALGAGRETREIAFGLLAFGLALITLSAVVLVLRSRYGLALVAVRDCERAAEALGVNALAIKRGVYIGVGGLTALAGGLIFVMNLRMTPDGAFSVLDWTAYVLFIVIIGGSGRIEGPFIGTIVFFALRGLFSSFGPIYLVVLGAVAIAVMLFAPGGLWSLISARIGHDLLAIRRTPRRREAPKFQERT